MATITEDYVSFETAKLLKEKGFPQEYDIYHSMVYNEEDYEDEYEVKRMVLETRLIKAGTLSSYPIGVPEPKCYCPTLQMAMKWLREVHNIDFIIFHEKLPNDCYWARIERHPFTEFQQEPEYKTYEESVEAALKYSLKNLI